eukprot:m.136058 g.136058  ORF g.136058 m.136058 type:complete len:184 (+) comp10390_c0_seq1:132-683(+)
MTVLLKYFSKPSAILRYLELLGAIIVFGSASELPKAYNNRDWAITLGVFSMLIALAFIGVAVVKITSSSLSQVHVQVFYTELAVNGIFSFIWFVSFCKWADDARGYVNNSGEARRLNSILAFAFFNSCFWGVSTFLTWMEKGQEAQEDDFAFVADPTSETEYVDFNNNDAMPYSTMDDDPQGM